MDINNEVFKMETIEVFNLLENNFQKTRTEIDQEALVTLFMTALDRIAALETRVEYLEELSKEQDDLIEALANRIELLEQVPDAGN